SGGDRHVVLNIVDCGYRPRDLSNVALEPFVRDAAGQHGASSVDADLHVVRTGQELERIVNEFLDLSVAGRPHRLTASHRDQLQQPANRSDLLNAESRTGHANAKRGWSDGLTQETRYRCYRRRAAVPVNVLRHRLWDRLGCQAHVRYGTQRAGIDR